MRAFHSFGRLLLLLLVWGTAVSAFGGEPANEIKQTTDRILSIASNPQMKDPSKAQERRKLIRAAVDERFDWEEMARRSLAQYWGQRTSEERKEFVELYSDLLQRTYMSKVEDYSGEKVEYEGDNIQDGYAVVKVRIRTQKNRDIPVEYRVLKKGDRWLVYDISIEGVSLVNNYRRQFSSIITQSSYQALVKRLREKSDVK